jgi:hypothetical protein
MLSVIDHGAGIPAALRESALARSSGWPNTVAPMAAAAWGWPSSRAW